MTWELEKPVRRECYALYADKGVATVWTTFCTERRPYVDADQMLAAGETWTVWNWDATAAAGFLAEGVARSREEAQALASRMLDALVVMHEQYNAYREVGAPSPEHEGT